MTVINNMRLRPLVWVEQTADTYYCGSEPTGTLEAGNYWVAQNDGDDGDLWSCGYGSDVLGATELSQEAAVKACNDHNLARIMAELEPAGGE